MQANLDQKNFRVFGPDETASNRLQDVITGTASYLRQRPTAATKTCWRGFAAKFWSWRMPFRSTPRGAQSTR